MVRDIERVLGAKIDRRRLPGFDYNGFVPENQFAQKNGNGRNGKRPSNNRPRRNRNGSSKRWKNNRFKGSSNRKTQKNSGAGQRTV